MRDDKDLVATDPSVRPRVPASRLREVIASQTYNKSILISSILPSLTNADDPSFGRG